MADPEHSFYVGQWRATYRAVSLAAANEMQGRLDQLIRSELAEVCVQRLTQSIGGFDSSVWLVRDLNLNLRLSSEVAHAGQAAKEWGEHLAQKIQRTISHDREDDSVLYFPTRAAYVAQFARDLAAGRAHGKWYYDEFSSLLALPESRALRQVLTERTKHTGEALRRLLHLRALREVLFAMRETDARAVFDAWRGSHLSQDVSNTSSWVGRLLEIWDQTPLRGSVREDHPFRDALWWSALATSRWEQTSGEGAILNCVDQLQKLRSLLSRLDVQGREQLIRFLGEDEMDRARSVASAAGDDEANDVLTFFHANMNGDVHWARNALGALLGEDEYLRNTATPKISAYGPGIPSNFAGVFRLGPSLIASGLEAAIASLDTVRAASFRHLVAIRCLGADNPSQCGSDSAVQRFSSVSEIPFQESLPEAAEIPWPERDFRPYAGRCWLLDEVILPDCSRGVLLVRDVLVDNWQCGLLLGDSNWHQSVDAAISLIHDRADDPEPVIFIRSPRQQRDASCLLLNDDPDEHARLARELNVPTKSFVRGVRAASDDLVYLSLKGALPGLEDDLNVISTVWARAVLKHFARRLIGFDTSSAKHLRESFLSGVGLVRDTGDKITVELPPPPLAIVLRMAGILQESYTAPWTEGMEVCLLSQE